MSSYPLSWLQHVTNTYPREGATEELVLLAAHLVAHADDQGRTVFPAHMMAGFMGWSSSRLARVIVEGCASGWIEAKLWVTRLPLLVIRFTVPARAVFNDGIPDSHIREEFPPTADDKWMEDDLFDEEIKDDEALTEAWIQQNLHVFKLIMPKDSITTEKPSIHP